MGWQATEHYAVARLLTRQYNIAGLVMRKNWLIKTPNMLENQTNTNNLSGLLHKWFDKHLTSRDDEESHETSLLTKLTSSQRTLYKLVDDKHPRLAVSLDPGPDTAHCSALTLCTVHCSVHCALLAIHSNAGSPFVTEVSLAALRLPTEHPRLKLFLIMTISSGTTCHIKNSSCRTWILAYLCPMCFWFLEHLIKLVCLPQHTPTSDASRFCFDSNMKKGFAARARLLVYNNFPHLPVSLFLLTALTGPWLNHNIGNT